MSKSTLVITDHRTHYKYESIYSFVGALFNNNLFSNVCVVTRGDVRNEDFFAGRSTSFYGFQATTDFKRASPNIWLANSTQFDATEFDLALLRIDRPFSRLAGDDLKISLRNVETVLNDIDAIFRTKLKSYIKSFDQFVPDMAVCTSLEDLFVFKDRFDVIVVKPDDGYGSKGVVKFQGNRIIGLGLDTDSLSYLSSLKISGDNQYVAVEYLPKVSEGDNRLLIANGVLISSTLRVPEVGGWLSSTEAGNTVVGSTPSKRELEIMEYVDPQIRSEGIFLYTIDTIAGNDGQRLISEVNTQNPGILHIGDGENQDIEASTIVEELARFISR